MKLLRFLLVIVMLVALCPFYFLGYAVGFAISLFGLGYEHGRD